MCDFSLRFRIVYNSFQCSSIINDTVTSEKKLRGGSMEFFTFPVLLHPPPLPTPHPHPPKKGTNRDNPRQTVVQGYRACKLQRSGKKIQVPYVGDISFCKNQRAGAKTSTSNGESTPGPPARGAGGAGGGARGQAPAPPAPPPAGRETGKAPGERGRRVLSAAPRPAAPGDSPPLARPGSHRGSRRGVGIGCRASGPRG